MSEYEFEVLLTLEVQIKVHTRAQTHSCLKKVHISSVQFGFE
jgi:hypothetical protein